MIIAANGSFTITIDDGVNKKAFTLNRPYQRLLIVPGIWRDLDNFSSGAVLLCLASEHYIAEDYIRDYNEFIAYKTMNITESFELDRYGLHLRMVRMDDAEFIVRLRNDSKLGHYSHSTSNDVAKQSEWLHVLMTEDKGVVCGEDDCPCGRKGKYFKINGRLKNAEIRGCLDTYAVKFK